MDKIACNSGEKWQVKVLYSNTSGTGYWNFFLQANTAKSVEILGKTDSLSHFKVPQISWIFILESF